MIIEAQWKGKRGYIAGYVFNGKRVLAVLVTPKGFREVPLRALKPVLTKKK